MAPASTHAPHVDAEFDLDVRLSPVIRHGVAGALAQPSAVACDTQKSPAALEVLGRCADVPSRGAGARAEPLSLEEPGREVHAPPAGSA